MLSFPSGPDGIWTLHPGRQPPAPCGLHHRRHPSPVPVSGHRQLHVPSQVRHKAWRVWDFDGEEFILHFTRITLTVFVSFLPSFQGKNSYFRNTYQLCSFHVVCDIISTWDGQFSFHSLQSVLSGRERGRSGREAGGRREGGPGSHQGWGQVQVVTWSRVFQNQNGGLFLVYDSFSVPISFIL